MPSSPNGPFKGEARNLGYAGRPPTPEEGHQDFVKTTHLTFPLAPALSLEASLHAHQLTIQSLAEEIVTFSRKTQWQKATVQDFSQVTMYVNLSSGPNMLLPKPEASGPEALLQALALTQGSPEPATSAAHAKLLW